MLVAPADLPRARIAIGSAHTVRTVTGIDDLTGVLRVRGADVVLLDPELLDTAGVERLAICLDEHSYVPIIGYVSVSPTGMRHAMALATLGVRRVVLRGHDDQPSTLRALLEGTCADSLASTVLARVAPHLAQLPAELKRAVEGAFLRPHAFRTASDLAHAAGIPIRTCSRLFARAGLATPRAFVSAARVVRAYQALRGHSARVANVAARLGYGTPDALVRDTRRTTGLRPTTLAKGVTPELFIAHLVHRLRTRTGQPGRPRRPHLVSQCRRPSVVTRHSLPSLSNLRVRSVQPPPSASSDSAPDSSSPHSLKQATS